ncbi:hypothetical protein K2Z83_17025 [Oscillochloris sp. ZM17-4]|uniref:DUF7309 domain-containing protein n=1 Tax=Oscillochloris sp. ZM17-4 TaxID=2866714 RepID=UPI001C72F730|nr:hypothetical protein [Oscillochloris sp. ZM17-4]MBX0329375.1 hypothetical protein [Oscillochloris sp. ZM17-4]
MISTSPAAPTEQEWRALYAAAVQLKALEPWEWMLDDDIFGVRDPETQQIGYCCIMGNLGEHFALAVYLGDEGLRGYLQIQSGAFEENPIEALFSQLCLQVSFEDREMLTKDERAQIKALGLKYRGRNAWPSFRNYTPGYFPWALSAPEARFLTLAIEQACEVAARFADDPEILDPPVDGALLLRERAGEGWREIWHQPDLTPPLPAAAPPVDELRLQRLRQAKLRRTGAWESGRFSMPQPVQDRADDRPYYPVSTLFVDAATGMVLAPGVGDPEGWREAYQEQCLDLIEQGQVLPREIASTDVELRDLLAPICAALGIKLKARETPMFDDVRESFLAYFDRM